MDYCRSFKQQIRLLQARVDDIHIFEPQTIIKVVIQKIHRKETCKGQDLQIRIRCRCKNSYVWAWIHITHGIMRHAWDRLTQKAHIADQMCNIDIDTHSTAVCVHEYSHSIGNNETVLTLTSESLVSPTSVTSKSNIMLGCWELNVGYFLTRAREMHRPTVPTG